MDANPPPPPPRTSSTTIQRNADKLLDIVHAERTNAISTFTPRLVAIERHLLQLQDTLSSPASPNDLARLQNIFMEFRSSSGILEANAARIKELEAALAQLHADNQGLHANISAATRAATAAREKEEQAKSALTDLLSQLAVMGIGRREDGKLGFSPEWKVMLEEFGKHTAQAPNQRAAPARKPSIDTTTTVIDLVADSPTNDPSNGSQPNQE